MAEKGGIINDEEKHGYEETDCGWFNCRPSCLNCTNSPRWLVTVICLYALIFGITGNGFTNVAITSIERRFELPSARSGLIPPTYDITAAFSIVFISFVGARGRKPRWLASGMFLLGVGTILFTLPHFLTGEYQQASANATLLCPGSQKMDCDKGENSISALSKYLYVFIFAQIIFGIGAPSVYSLGVTFIDESVPSHTAGLYLGILSSCFIIGPAFGYIIGSVFLNFYTDFLTVDSTTLTIDTNSPQWVGAWWLGYLFAAVLMFILVIPLSCLPPQLKGTKDIQDQRISQAHSKTTDKTDSPTKKGSGVKWRDVPKVVKSLVTNPTYVLVTAASVSDSLFIGGAEVFLPKFLETQFGLTASFAALQTGLYLVIFGGGSLVATGWIIKRFKLKVVGMLKMALVTSIICMFGMIGQLLSCDEIPLAGISVPYIENRAETPTDVMSPHELLEAECNSDCQCSTEEYTPVCGTHNGIAYFSPCHAGCTEYNEETKEFGNCTCIEATIDESLPATSAIGICIGQCWQYYVYCIVLAIVTTTLLMNGTLLLNLILRCVPDHSRDYALGMYGFCTRVLGSFIGPILFGYLIDASCILWHEECGERGRCWAYNRNQVAFNMLFTGVVIKALETILFGLAIWTYRPPVDNKDEPADGRTNPGFQQDEVI